MKKLLILVLVLGFAASAMAALPSVTGTVVQHFDASAITGVSDGAALGTWTASTGGDATASGSYQPTYLTNQVNGKAAVLFDAADDHMDFSLAVGRTAFAVVKSNGAEGQQNMWMGGGQGTAWNNKFGHVGTSITLMDYVIDDDTTLGTADYRIVSWSMITGDIPNGIWLDGAAVADREGSGVNANINPMNVTTIGAERSASHASGPDNIGPNAYIAELILYDDVLSAADRQAVTDYLGAEYGITVVPEPATIMLLGLGGLALIRKKR